MEYREHRYASACGRLTLFARDYGGTGKPVLMMHGLTRNSGDFEGLAQHLAGQYRLVEKANGAWVVTDQRKGGGDGTDRLSDIEVLKFKDRKIVLDASKGKSAPQPASAKEGESEHVRTVDDSFLDAALTGRPEVARSAGYDVGVLHVQAAPEAAAVPALLHDLHV